MGESAAQTVREIEAIRDRIDEDLDALGETLPPPETLKKQAMLAAVGGVVAVFSLWYLSHRLRVRSEDRRVKRLVKEAIEELTDR